MLFLVLCGDKETFMCIKGERVMFLHSNNNEYSLLGPHGYVAICYNLDPGLFAGGYVYY